MRIKWHWARSYNYCCCGKSESTTYGDWAGSLVGIGTELRAGESTIYYWWTDRDISPVQAGPRDQQASWKMGGKLSSTRIRSRTVHPVSQSINRLSYTAKIYVYVHLITFTSPPICPQQYFVVVDCVWNVMAHEQKNHISSLQSNGRVHLNWPVGVSSVNCWQPRCAHQQ
jgi:hypothetical protein